MRFPALLVAVSCFMAIAASAAATPDARLANAYKFNEGGWTYVHLQGTPTQVGFQHGYLLAREIEDNVHVYKVEAPRHTKRAWSFFRDAGRNVLWPHLDAEYQKELTGIAAGAEGARVDTRCMGCGSAQRLYRAFRLLSAVADAKQGTTEYARA